MEEQSDGYPPQDARRGFSLSASPIYGRGSAMTIMIVAGRPGFGSIPHLITRTL